MRHVLVGLLSLLVVVAVGRAAPAPLSKDRGENLPSTGEVANFVSLEHGLEVESVEPQGKGTWIVFAHWPMIYWSKRAVTRSRAEARVYVAKYRGKNDQGRPQFTLIDLEEARRGLPR
jgi:hypothetical protein